jgi:hypothetical protein
MCSILCLVLLGCSDESAPPPSSPLTSDAVEVTGEVAFIYDNVPADGGAFIDLKLEDGKSERLLFAPFYWGDDSEDRWQLYGKIKEVQLGDRVKAVGQRTERGVELEDITILDR